MNKYEDMSVLEVLKQIKNEFIFLPDIQREYCWDMSDIESLFESIVDGYPIGSFIFWKTNRKKLNETKPNLYKFLSVYKPNYTKNEEAPESFDEEGDYFIVLDGQQRLTSMNIALKGKFITKKKFKKVNNREAWVERELYYNLNFHNVKQDEKDEENPEKRFVFLSKEECENGNYFKIKNILEYSSVVECVQKLGEITSQKEVVEDLSVLFEKLNSSGSGTIHYYCITKNDYDEALNIFVKVNSTGKKLSKTDLLFSTLIDGWKEGKKLIDSTIQTINQKGRFNFKRDYVMRLCLVLVDASAKLKIESLKKQTTLFAI